MRDVVYRVFLPTCACLHVVWKDGMSNLPSCDLVFFFFLGTFGYVVCLCLWSVPFLTAAADDDDDDDGLTHCA